MTLDNLDFFIMGTVIGSYVAVFLVSRRYNTTTKSISHAKYGIETIRFAVVHIHETTAKLNNTLNIVQY
jgi:hypothetical protein